jgi:hypothetical protein
MHAKPLSIIMTGTQNQALAMSTSQYKYVVTSGIPGVQPGFKPLSWLGHKDAMFSLGIARLLAWFTAAQVQVTEIYGRSDVCVSFNIYVEILTLKRRLEALYCRTCRR